MGLACTIICYNILHVASLPDLLAHLQIYIYCTWVFCWIKEIFHDLCIVLKVGLGMRLACTYSVGLVVHHTHHTTHKLL